MAKSDKYMADHVRSAKVWLEKAEQSFNSQSDIKGELNLMLAEAEMKNLRKKRAAAIGVKEIVIAGMAAIAAIVGIGWFWYERQDEPVVNRPVRQFEERQVRPPAPKPVAPPTTPAPADDMAPIEMTPADIEGPAYVPTQPAVPEMTPTASPGTAVDTSSADPVPPLPQTPAAPVDTPTEDTPVLTDQQIQDAVQDARHTLRSTVKETK